MHASVPHTAGRAVTLRGSSAAPAPAHPAPASTGLPAGAPADEQRRRSLHASGLHAAEFRGGQQQRDALPASRVNTDTIASTHSRDGSPGGENGDEGEKQKEVLWRLQQRGGLLSEEDIAKERERERERKEWPNKKRGYATRTRHL